jgi:amino acid adenylation domain-containing protein
MSSLALDPVSPAQKREFINNMSYESLKKAKAFPLSFAQQRLWLMDQLEPGNPSYNISGGLLLSGELKIEALEQAFTEIARRHTSLRTTFARVDNQPTQFISPVEPVRLAVTDLSELPIAEREAGMKDLAHTEARRPFDLAYGPVWRVQLVRLGAAAHVLLLSLHHIIGDGWSLRLLVNEISALYQAFSSGRPSPLSELQIQYVDYAAWQREWQEKIVEGHLNYWKAQFGGPLPALELPTDKTRPPIRSYRGAHLPLSFSMEETDALRQLSRRHGMTLFMTLLAGWQILLWRYTGEADIVVGSPIANRPRRELETLIGFFVNTLALRTNISSEISVRELMQRVREVCIDAYAHQDMPFEMLVEELAPERNLSHTPLFQVMMTLQDALPKSIELPDLTLNVLDVDNGTAKFDLTLALENGAEGLSGYLEYNTDLFEAHTIDRMASHYRTLMLAMVADQEQSIRTLSMLSAAEQDQLLVQWNQTTTDFQSNQSIAELISTQVQHAPDALAVIGGETQLTYAQLSKSANQLARRLKALGVGPETCVGVYLERSPKWIICLLAVLKTGGAYLPIDLASPAERVAFMLEDAQARVLLTTEPHAAKLAGPSAQVICLDSEWHTLASESVENLEITPAPDSLAYVIYTSGSTGWPKGVAVTHRGLLNLVHWYRQAFALNSADQSTQVAGLGFDATVWEVWPQLTAGASIYLANEEARISAEALRDWLVAEQITVSYVPTPLTEALLALEWPSNTALRLLITGGDTLHRFPAPSHPFVVMNNYGPTENTVVVSSGAVEPNEQSGLLPHIGKPIANVQVYVLGPQLEVVPIGVVGELYVGGASQARGYMGHPEITAERFVPNPYGRNGGERLYRTGDLVRYLADGNLEYIGRTDQQVKIRGYRIELGEIEAVLEQHDEVDQAVVTTRGDGGQKRLVAYVVAQKETTRDAAGLRVFLQERLPSYMIPAAIVFIDKTPLTPNGKVDQRALPEPDWVRTDDDVAPRTQTEEILAGLWTQLLGVDHVGVNSNFFELGGHSLLATQLVSRLLEVFHVELPLRALFTSPTISELAQVIETAVQTQNGLTATSPIKPQARNENPPLSFAQQRLWFLEHLKPNSSLYLIPCAARLIGPLNVAALEQSLNEIVRRHEVLRTTFAANNGRPFQVISPTASLTLEVIDLSDLPETGKEAAVNSSIREESRRPFDLSAGPLLRASLLRLAADEHVLLFTMHHIISDGWSFGVLIHELAVLYRDYSQSQASSLRELPIQYADFSAWQRQWLQGEALEQQLNYWKQQLGGELPLLRLPTDRPYPAVQTTNGNWHLFSLPAELTKELNTLSRREGVTLFMTLLAAFQTLLHRYTNQDDVITGSVIANRNRKETEGLIGFFLNPLALRTDFSGDPSFRELLQRVAETTLGAYAHQDLPFEKLTEVLQPDRNLSHPPFFQVMFVLQNAPLEELQLPGLILKPVPVHKGTAGFDWELSLTEKTNGLEGWLEYNTDLFDETTIQRIAGHLGILLRGIVADPNRRLSEFSILTPDERTHLLHEGNELPVKQLVHHVFERQVRQTPDAIAVVSGNERLTYAELNRRTNVLATALVEHGIQPDDIVALVTEPGIEMLTGMLAVLKSGGAYLHLDPFNFDKQIIAHSGCATVLSTTTSIGILKDLGGTILTIEDVVTQNHGAEDLTTTCTPANLASVPYHADSEGTFKALMIEHQTLIRHLNTKIAALQLNASDHLAEIAYPLSNRSLDVALACLLAGATVHIFGDEINCSTKRFNQELVQQAISILNGMPPVLQALADEGFAGSDLRAIVWHGESLPIKLAAQWLNDHPQVRVINGSGWNEYPGVNDIIDREAFGAHYFVLDHKQSLLPIGIDGELYVGGPGIGRGYLHDVRTTAAEFAPNPFSSDPGARIYKTGESACSLPNGKIKLKGRDELQFKVRGCRVGPGEIEAALLEYPSINEAVVVAADDDSLIAYIVFGDKQQSAAEDVRDFLQKRLPQYLVPRLCVLEVLPRTSAGNIDRRALPQPVGEPAGLNADFEGPRTPTEHVVSGIWQEVLGVPRIGIHDKFFELGGDSLKLLHTYLLLNELYPDALTVADLFKHGTIEFVSSHLDSVSMNLNNQAAAAAIQSFEL